MMHYLMAITGSGGIALQIRAFVTLTEDQVSILITHTPSPSTHTNASEPPITPFPWNIMPSSDLCYHQQHMWCIYWNAGKTVIYIKFSNLETVSKMYEYNDKSLEVHLILCLFSRIIVVDSTLGPITYNPNQVLGLIIAPGVGFYVSY